MPARAASTPAQEPVAPPTRRYHEWSGRALGSGDARQTTPSPHWGRFAELMGASGWADLDERNRRLARQVRDNGVSYNVYADPDQPQRPWSLDLLPLIIPPEPWAHIERGVQQRMRLLEHLLADAYGPQRAVRDGFIPSSVLLGAPGYLRSMHGVEALGGQRLCVAAFDLARDADGLWWLVSQRLQAPSGLGYLLENRLTVRKLLPECFEAMPVQRLAASYRALVAHLRAHNPGGPDGHLALLTPGPYTETYFEHAYLARQLGLTLVQGSDLTVRGERLYLRTLRGLQPVHALLKRLDDEYLDPLELRADSQLGVPGLLQAVRAGQVMMANLPGAGWLESPALLGFMPALAQAWLGEALTLPTLPTWWCGERAALHDVLPRLRHCVIKPTERAALGVNPSSGAVLGHTLDERALNEWAGRIARQGEDFTVQSYLPLAHMPVWPAQATGAARGPEALQSRSYMLRVYALADGQGGWQVLPGGLARLGPSGSDTVTMQRGGSSADVWVLTQGAIDTHTRLRDAATSTTSPVGSGRHHVTSRAAENLFWLGRYTERAENTVRLAQVTLEALASEDTRGDLVTAQWLHQLCMTHGVVPWGTPSPSDHPDAKAASPLGDRLRQFERSVVLGLAPSARPDAPAGVQVASVDFNLRALRQSASHVRERLSLEHWALIDRAPQQLERRLASLRADGHLTNMDALAALRASSQELAAITGAQTDRMARDDGWRLLSIGRLIERLGFFSSVLLGALQEPGAPDTHTSADTGADANPDRTEGRNTLPAIEGDALLTLFDSMVTFQSQFAQRRDWTALVEALVLDRDNPRALAWVVHTLRGRMARLDGRERGDLGGLATSLPHPDGWPDQMRQPSLIDATDPPHQPPQLQRLATLLTHLREQAWALSESVSTAYFTHVHSGRLTH